MGPLPRREAVVASAAPTRPATARPRVLSSAHGPLRHVLLCFPYEAALRPGYRAAYADLLAKLPEPTRVTLLVDPRADDVVDELVAGADRRATTTRVRADADLRFTVWAQDPCLTLQRDDGQTTLLTPAAFDREQDASAVEVLAHATGVRVQHSSLRFHGGHVLVGDDFVLVGRDCRQAGFQELLDPARQVIFVGTDRPLPEERTRRIVVKGREVVEIRAGGEGSPHPLGHLDMFITLAGRGPTGRYRILVGSPALADDLLGREPADAALSAHFDDVAAQLAGHGFDVWRNPLPLTYGDGRRDVDGQRRDVRLWYLATANNCLVQIDDVAGDHVWLPTYGHGAWRELAVTDAANRRLWEQLGFTVHELTSFHAFAQRFGALHCIAKDLDRHPRAPPVQ